MKLIAKNDKLIVEDGFIEPNEGIEFVPIKPLNQKFEVSYDGKTYHLINDYSFKIPRDQLKKGSVKFYIKVINISTGKSKVLETEDLKVSNFYTIGKSTEERYPKALHEIHSRMKKLEKRIEALESEGDLL